MNAFVQAAATHYNYWVAMALMMIGLYVVMSHGNFIKKLLGLNIFQVAVFMLYISLGKVDGGGVRAVGEVVVIGQLLHLLGRSGNEPVFAEADADAPQAGHRLDVAFAVVVEDENPLAVLDDLRALLGMRHGVGVGVEVVGDVAGFGRIGGECHLLFRVEWWRFLDWRNSVR